MQVKQPPEIDPKVKGHLWSPFTAVVLRGWQAEIDPKGYIKYYTVMATFCYTFVQFILEQYYKNKQRPEIQSYALCDVLKLNAINSQSWPPGRWHPLKELGKGIAGT